MTKQNRPRRRRQIGSSDTIPSIKLHLLPDALDADGMPRAALEVPSQPGASHRPVLLLFASIAAALAAKRSMEAGQ